MTFDEIRAARPGLGFATYALEPGGPVRFEIYDGAEVFGFEAASQQDAINQAFPPALDDVAAGMAPAIEAPDLFD